MQITYFIKRFEEALKERWNQPAIDEFRKSTITYSQLAEAILKNHLLYRRVGLKREDKIAINARSCAKWAEIFFSAVSGGYTTVQLFNGFAPKDSQGLVCHSESRILYTERTLFSKMQFEQMQGLLAAIDLLTGELLASRGNFEEEYNNLEQNFRHLHPNGINREEINFEERSPYELCAIMYTSGSTGNPKGVMLNIKNISANIDLIPHTFPYKKGDSYVSVLPYAHIFGMVYDMVMPLCTGMHLCILGLPPVPSNLKPALAQYNPSLFFAVPMILKKMIDATIGEIIKSKSAREKLEEYKNYPDFCSALKSSFMEAFGKNLKLIVTGGAAISEEIETLLATKLQVPFVTGYGMTEAAPTICLGKPGNYKLKSVGAYQKPWVELKIDSSNPQVIPGEVLIKGDVLFTGYYKAPETTGTVFTEDGWFRTGDVGIIDNDNVVYLMGRCKNMILTDNGQNIFPEEIEVLLNAMPLVSESLIVERKGILTAIIVPTPESLSSLTSSHLGGDSKLGIGQGNQNAGSSSRPEGGPNGIGNLGSGQGNQNAGSSSQPEGGPNSGSNLGSGQPNAERLYDIMKQNIQALNTHLPAYARVSNFELHPDPFAKTPKGSIKRFMYH